ncbi:MAG: carboxypeptidase regulatory-like domain-containing protein [Candidatus Electryoneaceae bacterium]|nr:carboxypeptidase regulatory-like domain-containing protein [Candidatus Electryoneaceae bacterium]
MRLVFLSIIIMLTAGYSPAVADISQTGHSQEYNQGEIRSITENPDAPFSASSGRISATDQVDADTPHRDEGEGELLWETFDENGISENVALSADGQWVAVGYSLNDERFELRSADDGEIAFTYEVEEGPSRVAISEDGTIAAYAAAGNVWLFDRDEGDEPIFNFQMDGYLPGPVALSRNGRVLVATGNDHNAETHSAWCFLDGELQWTVEVDAGEAYGWYGIEIARNGSVVALTGKYHLYIVDVETGELLWDTPTYNTEFPAVLSADGFVLVIGSLTERFRVFNRVADGVEYEELWHYNFRGARSSWVNSVAISADGMTIGAGTLDFHEDHYGGRMALFDTYGRGEPLWITESFADEVADISISDNGGIIAAVSWGDINHQTADLLLYEPHSNEPFYQLVTPGSLDEVAMSDDGLRIVAGGKSVHNRQFGRGGRGYMIEATYPGGYVSGIVCDENDDPLSGVEVSADDNPYTTVTDEEGHYRLPVEVEDEREIDVTARIRGYLYGVEENVQVVRNQVTEDIDFSLSPVDPPWLELSASQGQRNVIILEWVEIDRMMTTSAVTHACSPTSVVTTPRVTENWQTRASANTHSTSVVTRPLRVARATCCPCFFTNHASRRTGISALPGNRTGRGGRLPAHQDVTAATGEPSPIPSVAMTLWDDEPMEPHQHPRRDEPEQYNIYRGYLSDGPYALIGSVDGDERTYEDRGHIFPQRQYYYVITADFGDGESVFTNEAVGWMDDEFLVWEVDLEDMPNVPDIDGTIGEDEWEGSVLLDISDVFGYDEPDTAGTVDARIGFDDETNQLFLAFQCYSVEELHDQMGVGVYIDDDGNGGWTYERSGSEGNYWGYWIDDVPDMRYRSLSGAPYNVDPYYTFDDPSLAFNDDNGYVEIEMAIPLGFHEPYETALYAPDYEIGLALFEIHRDDDGNAIFDGWWPQNIMSIVSNPEQFAIVHIPVDLAVPPALPQNIAVGRVGGSVVSEWEDPTLGIDDGDLEDFAGLHIYRNGELLATVEPEEEEFWDEEVLPGGWYEYTLGGYILDDDEPFFGPFSQPVGVYAGEEPQITEIIYDDGTPEGWYVVSFGEGNHRWAIRFDLNDMDTVGVYWIDFMANSSSPIDISIAADNNGVPGEVIGSRYRTTPVTRGEFHRFHFPAIEQPRVILDEFQWGECWVILNYLEESPGAPGIGMDRSHPNVERNLYNLGDEGWQPFGVGQLMVRLGIGRPPDSSSPGDEPYLPETFSVEQNFPNPFNAVSIIPINMPIMAPVRLELYDVSGRLVIEQSLGELSEGRHPIPFDGSTLGTGVYIVRVICPTEEAMIKIAVIK